MSEETVIALIICTVVPLVYTVVGVWVYHDTDPRLARLWATWPLWVPFWILYRLHVPFVVLARNIAPAMREAGRMMLTPRQKP